MKNYHKEYNLWLNNIEKVILNKKDKNLINLKLLLSDSRLQDMLECFYEDIKEYDKDCVDIDNIWKTFERFVIPLYKENKELCEHISYLLQRQYRNFIAQ